MSASPTSSKRVGRAFLFWAAVTLVVWAGVPVLAKQGAGNLNGVEMTLWINLFALPVVTLWILPKAHRQSLASYSLVTILTLVCVGFLGNLLFQVFYFGSYQTITAITGSVLGRFGSILFVVASIVFLRERHSVAYIAAVVLASIGAILSAATPGANFEIAISIGFWLMTIAALLNTGYMFANNALKKRLPDENANLFVYKASTLFVVGVWAIAVQSPLINVRPELQVNLQPQPSDLMAPFLIGAFADGVGFLSFLKMLSLSDSVKATLVTSMVAIAQVFLAVVVYQEAASVINAIVAPALVIIPTAFASLKEARSVAGVNPQETGVSG